MRYCLFFIAFSFTYISAFAQKKLPNEGVVSNHKQEIEVWRKQKDEDYKNPEKTMLPAELMKDFTGLKYYGIDYNYVVKGRLERTVQAQTISISTSTGGQYDNFIYGTVYFTLHGKEMKLQLYQSVRSAELGRTKGALLLPFTDVTSGEETFGGGRYLVFDIPEGDEMTLDFNRAYNPYCVYDPSHSCPIPPAENHLKIKVEAGEKMYP
ncbi:MAG: DUF1684 domain-containing protein [Cyclobacteriaceae bacterium]|nr:DUF1684 domain-containing protein [Cyclobacteriaceae bacterium]